MDPVKHKEITANILQNLGDQATVSKLLTELVDDYTVVTGDLTQKRKSIEDLEAETKKLQKTNMDLFLKIPINSAGSAAADTKSDTDPETPTFESLFDPKTGKLKE